MSDDNANKLRSGTPVPGHSREHSEGRPETVADRRHSRIQTRSALLLAS